MVTRNRSEGSGSPNWWDDLPAQMRSRFSQPLVQKSEPEVVESEERSEDVRPSLGRGELIIDLSRLAALFALIAFGNIAFLIAALYFLCG